MRHLFVFATWFLVLSQNIVSADDQIDEIYAQYQEAQRHEKDPKELDRLSRDVDALARLRSPSVLGERWIQRETYVVDGTFTLTGDTVITSNTIIFKEYSVIVTGGFRLLLDAQSVILNKGVRIDGTGQVGTPGQAGSSHTASWQSQRDADYYSALADCRKNSGHPDRGGNGDPGNQGHSGSIIVLRGPFDLSQLQVKVDGGAGGAGGPGGSGKLLKNGRNNYCDGCMQNCPSGNPGAQGPEGPRGDIISLPASDPTPPNFSYFDDASEYRIYPTSKVAKGSIEVTVMNRHPNNMVRFEVWKDSNGSTLPVETGGGGQVVATTSLGYVERLVWVGHKTLMTNLKLDSSKGWRIEFRRNR